MQQITKRAGNFVSTVPNDYSDGKINDAGKYKFLECVINELRRLVLRILYNGYNQHNILDIATDENGLPQTLYVKVEWEKMRWDYRPIITILKEDE